MKIRLIECYLNRTDLVLFMDKLEDILNEELACLNRATSDREFFTLLSRFSQTFFESPSLQPVTSALLRVLTEKKTVQSARIMQIAEVVRFEIFEAAVIIFQSSRQHFQNTGDVKKIKELEIYIQQYELIDFLPGEPQIPRESRRLFSLVEIAILLSNSADLSVGRYSEKVFSRNDNAFITLISPFLIAPSYPSYNTVWEQFSIDRGTEVWASADRLSDFHSAKYDFFFASSASMYDPAGRIAQYRMILRSLNLEQNGLTPHAREVLTEDAKILCEALLKFIRLSVTKDELEGEALIQATYPVDESIESSFFLSDTGIEREGRVAHQSKSGNRRKLCEVLMPNKAIFKRGMRKPGRIFTLEELEKLLPEIADLPNDLRRISRDLSSTHDRALIRLTLPKSIKRDTCCQIICTD